MMVDGQPAPDRHDDRSLLASQADVHERSTWGAWLTRTTDEEDWAPADDELVADGAGHLLQLVSAVRHLRRGLRPGLSVWDALEEALRWHITELITTGEGAPDPDEAEIDPADPDPLGTQLGRLVDLLDVSKHAGSDTLLQQAVRLWTTAMANAYNRGHPWPETVSHHGI